MTFSSTPSLRIALAVPCAAFIPERAASLARLERELFGPLTASGLGEPIEVRYKAFTDKERWHPTSAKHPDGEGPGWFLRMLQWGEAQDADFFITLQDDVTVAPNFWSALVAIIEAWKPVGGSYHALSLVSNHSQAREQARQGRRSYFTNAIVGWAWGLPKRVLQEFLLWYDTDPVAAYRKSGFGIGRWLASHPGGSEDNMLAEWLTEVVRVPIRHPLPTIVDQEFMRSTFEGNDLHSHRRSVVTWRDYSSRDMAEPSWWRGYAAELPLDIARACLWCGDREAAAYSPKTGAGMCVACMPHALCQWCGKGVVVARAPDTGYGICKDCFMMPGRVFQRFLPGGKP